jgi:hypothetical protein
MAAPDLFIAGIVSAMFMAGVVLVIVKVRQRSKTRKQWLGNAPASLKKY